MGENENRWAQAMIWHEEEKGTECGESTKLEIEEIVRTNGRYVLRVTFTILSHAVNSTYSIIDKIGVPYLLASALFFPFLTQSCLHSNQGNALTNPVTHPTALRLSVFAEDAWSADCRFEQL